MDSMLDLVYVLMYTAYNIKWAICDGKYFLTLSIFCKYSSKFSRHLIYSLPVRKNQCHGSDVGCLKSESDTCKEGEESLSQIGNQML